MGANASIGDIVATTLRNRQSQIADNVSQNNALLSRLKARGNVNNVAGGRTILQPLIFAENGSFQFYSGYEALDTTPTEVIDAAEFNWKQANVNVIYSGLETRIQNAGKEQVIDLLDARIQAAEITMANKISVSIYGDGSTFGGKSITGLGALMTSTGTYGGINKATYTFWKPQDSGAVNGISTSTDTLKREMRDLWIECTRGNETPDLIIAEALSFQRFWESLSDIQRITTAGQGVAGFQSLKFVNADVVYDGDSIAAAGVTTSRMYFLNTKYLFFRSHPEANFTALDERNPVNQDAGVVPMIWAGNLTCSQARVQGILRSA